MTTALEIKIDCLRVRACHGCLPQERAVGNDFEVSVALHLRDYDGSDRLGATVNYADVIALVKREMAVPSDLIEHVACRIAASIVRNHPMVSGGHVTVIKLRPPVAAVLESVSVTVPIKTQ